MSTSDLLASIWNDRLHNDNTNKIRIKYEHLVYDALENADEYNPHNWKPNSCSYLTSDKLSPLVTLQNYLTITHLNIRSLKKNFQPLLKYLSNFKSLPQMVSLWKHG